MRMYLVDRILERPGWRERTSLAGVLLMVSTGVAAAQSDKADTASDAAPKPAVVRAGSPAPTNRFDLNGDGKVDRADVMLFLALMNPVPNAPQATVALRDQADFNRDGRLDNKDLALLLAQSGPMSPPTPQNNSVFADGPAQVGGQTVQSIPLNPTIDPGTMVNTSRALARMQQPTVSPPAGGVVQPGGTPLGGTGQSASSGPFLLPGSGFTASTQQPAPVNGQGLGASAVIIARWDTVPFQIFSDVINIGVMAFHIDGVSRVEFAANGGAWTPVSTMRLNPTTNVWDYYITLRAADFQDGPVEVRAVAYPSNGVLRVLPPLRLYANSRSSLAQNVRWASATGDDARGDGSQANPFRTIYKAAQAVSAAGGRTGADNGVVMLTAGAYEYRRPDGSDLPVTTNTWLTIQAAPGVQREQVSIVSPPAGQQANGGMATRLVRLRNVTVKGTIDTITPMEDYLWLDSILHVGAGPNDMNTYFTLPWWTEMYATDSTARNVVNGFTMMALARNCTVDTLFADGFPGCLAVVNSTVRNQVVGVNANGEAFHSDIWQDRSPYTDENIILYGVTGTDNCRGTAIFLANMSQNGMAVVNCNFNLTGYPNQSQVRTRANHLLVMNNTFLGAPLLLGISNTSPVVASILGSTNSVMRDNVFQWVNLDDPGRTQGPSYPAPTSLGNSLRFERNHFINLWPSNEQNAGQPIWCAQPIGTSASTGLSIPAGKGAYGTGRPPFAN